jgi:hypothetical protein
MNYDNFEDFRKNLIINSYEKRKQNNLEFIKFSKLSNLFYIYNNDEFALISPCSLSYTKEYNKNLISEIKSILIGGSYSVTEIIRHIYPDFKNKPKFKQKETILLIFKRYGKNLKNDIIKICNKFNISNFLYAENVNSNVKNLNRFEDLIETRNQITFSLNEEFEFSPYYAKNSIYKVSLNCFDDKIPRYQMLTIYMLSKKYKKFIKEN